jgi:uncharacterized protein (TIGR02757 family)
MKVWLEDCYAAYNLRRFVSPDPLECLYAYDRLCDREIAGLVAASLAYGQVRQIVRSVRSVLGRMGESPHGYVTGSSAGAIAKDMAGFSHRFATGSHVAALLVGIRRVLDEYGSVYNCFCAGLREGDRNVYPALSRFSDALRKRGEKNGPGHLVACPEKGSACKRMNLYLRWMVRCDRVDPGGWEGVSASRLIIPLDVHMFRIGCALRLTRRRQANMKAALEITEGFRRHAPEDPVRYDFALSRFGIRKGLPDQAICLLPAVQ